MHQNPEEERESVLEFSRGKAEPIEYTQKGVGDRGERERGGAREREL